METEHSSMESFEAVGENTGEESYTIIDRNKLEKDIEDETGSDWDLALSLQPSSVSTKEKIRKSSNSEDEIENEKSEISSPPFSLVTAPGEALPPTSKIETKRYASSSLQKMSSNSMSQSVMEEKEEYISQSRARSLQKHNKDLLIQNKKLSSLLTQEKQKSKELLRIKDEEIAEILTQLCKLQDENGNLTDKIETLTTEVRNLKIALQVKSEALAARTDEVEYLNNENERLKRNADEYHRDIEKLKEEIMKIKRRENPRESSSTATATSSSRSSEQHSRKPREHYHHSSSSSQRRERSRDQPQGEDHREPAIRQHGSAVRDSRLERLEEPNVQSRAYESLKKVSAITVCPVCGEERPYEKAMEMTQHVEECLRKKGYT